jgi:hypothetical protein
MLHNTHITLNVTNTCCKNLTSPSRFFVIARHYLPSPSLVKSNKDYGTF